VSDKSKRRGFGFCFRRGHKVPQLPKARECKKGRRGLRFAKKACRKVNCHRGLYAGCVFDVCKSGHAGSVPQHLAALNKLGKKCRPFKGLKKYHKNKKLCFTGCKNIWKSCKKAADCAKQINGKSYVKTCKKRRRVCRKACRKNWRKAVKCVKRCFRKQRGCRKLARCAAPLANLRSICKARSDKCSGKCFTRVTKN